MTKKETQAVKEVLMTMLLQGGYMERQPLLDLKASLHLKDVGLVRAGFCEHNADRYTITPKGIAFVEEP